MVATVAYLAIVPPGAEVFFLPPLKTSNNTSKGRKRNNTEMALVCLKDYEEAAREKLPKAHLGYCASGATTENTLRENVESYQKWHIRPRFMRDVSQRDMSTTILGHKVSVPYGVAPTGMQKIAHHEGECATARAAASIGAPFTLSIASTSSIEEVSKAAANAIKFFQLYIYKDRNVSAKVVQRAERAGFKALVLTVDAPVIGIRYAEKRNQFNLPPHLRIANFENYGNEPSLRGEKEGISEVLKYITSLFDPCLTWKDIAWLKSITSLPIVVKGILTADDARLSLKAGVSAIWVSNHGGRQVDDVLPTMDALEEVVREVKGECEIYVDGGCRTGHQIFKALALGANMVFLGRPLLWGLACAGEAGARNVLSILREELDSTMALTGCPRIADITEQMICRADRLSKM